MPDRSCVTAGRVPAFTPVSRLRRSTASLRLWVGFLGSLPSGGNWSVCCQGLRRWDTVPVSRQVRANAPSCNERTGGGVR